MGYGTKVHVGRTYLNKRHRVRNSGSEMRGLASGMAASCVRI